MVHTYVIFPLSQVTAAGFEPLLKFAYTSKLLFGKDDVLEIRSSASILGFRDLDEACFDFLLPKFFSSKGSAPLLRKTCCKEKCKRRFSKEDRGIISDGVLDEKEAKPVADSPSQQEVVWLCNKSVNRKMGSQSSAGALTPAAEGTNDHFMQCPKYRRRLACGKETCVTEKSLNNPVAVIRDDCDLSCSPPSSSANSKNETEVELPGNSTSNPTGQSKGSPDHPWKSELPDKKTSVGGGEVDMVKKETNEKQGKWSKKERDMDMEEDIGFSDRSNVKAASSGPSRAMAEGSSGLKLHHCPLKTFAEGSAITGSLGHERFVMDITEDKKTRDSGVSASIHQKAEEQGEAAWKRADEEIDSGWLERGKAGQKGCMEGASHAGERSTTEREVAEHLAKRLGSDVGLSQLSFQDPDAGSSSDTGSGRAHSTSLEWLNFHVNLSSKSSGCPFLQDLDQSKCLWKGAELSECEGASQSGVSSLNSGEDGDSETETEGDSESYTRERARQVSG